MFGIFAPRVATHDGHGSVCRPPPGGRTPDPGANRRTALAEAIAAPPAAYTGSRPLTHLQ